MIGGREQNLPIYGNHLHRLLLASYMICRTNPRSRSGSFQDLEISTYRGEGWDLHCFLYILRDSASMRRIQDPTKDVCCQESCSVARTNCGKLAL